MDQQCSCGKAAMVLAAIALAIAGGVLVKMLVGAPAPVVAQFEPVVVPQAQPAAATLTETDSAAAQSVPSTQPAPRIMRPPLISSLRSTTQTLRSQIELYRVQHLDHAPDFARYPRQEQLTSATDETGLRGQTGPSFGPYLARAATNPLNGRANVAVVEQIAEWTGREKAGFVWDTTAGQLWPTDATAQAIFADDPPPQ